MVSVPVLGLRLVAEQTIELPTDKCNDCHGAREVIRALAGDRPCEYLIAVFLDGRNNITGASVLAIGGMHGAHVTTRDVFRSALVHQASAIVLGHNHPSVDPTPSAEDETFTRRAADAAEILGLAIVDHVIVTRTERFYSFLESGNASLRGSNGKDRD